ncbi:4-hydroxy-tetrahydrodipicolinate synthase [Suttonella sp. R2A3]|uniref:4-hydroxy-tetrahydrodipicolinate synthase n=1 Tax=Suttonella sp. R2A3 TaxID=2908648 RepID=UPI001F359FC9|nr:4-hydroxy-tetrahydrodipicolinate synthase [Suttonella sp. R2A3]UJF23911.1 4-hydroxy-tetrahydrodipicolinate synthase [Suttonella sp. R2A3]
MFQGSMVALVTPMHEDGAVDWPRLEQLIEWHIAEGTDGIVSVGTTGESATLSHDEHKAVTRFTVEMVKKRIPVIAGAGANATKEALELSISAYQSGVDGMLQVAPYYNKPPQKGLYEHFRTITEAVPLPMMLYNVPGRTSSDILPDTVAALSKFDKIIGIKEASTYERLLALNALFAQNGKRDFLIFSGEDGLAAQALCEGLIDGVVSVTANVAPRLMHEMNAAGLRGDREGCTQINEQLAPLHRALFCQSNPIPCKWALTRMGKINNGIRLPLVALDESYHAKLEETLQQLGFID